MSRVSVGYSGVHTAYQIALAAWEMGELRAFYCSVYDARGTWGRRLAGILGAGIMEGRTAGALPDRLIEEFWLPILAKRLRDRFYGRGINHWLWVNDWFDRHTAARLRASPPALFVGVSTADLHSLAAAREAGALLLHDLPHLHPTIEAALLDEARDRAGLPRAATRRRWRRDMNDRKLAEMQRADRLLTYSTFQRDTYVQAGVPSERIAVTPLWAEAGTWFRKTPYACDPARPLRVLYVGAISLRKGIPFLIEAARRCGGTVTLTMVGPCDGESPALLRDLPANVRLMPPQSKERLRCTYEAHDLFVLPSVGDAFGFVALEAMACGLPVVLSANCGAPAPAPEWKVPAMDSEALAGRIMTYAGDRDRLAADSATALAHARCFTAAAYRAAVRREMAALLDMADRRQ